MTGLRTCSAAWRAIRCRRQPTALASLLFCVWMSAALASRLGSLSFAPPFLDTDILGQRVVGETWKTDGVTRTAKKFVRLTPDRQSKRGSMWSQNPVGLDTFAVVFEFRISGQGARFFGDGMALWIASPELPDPEIVDEQKKLREQARAAAKVRHDARLKNQAAREASDSDDYWDSDSVDYYGEEYREDFELGEFHGYIEKFRGVGVVFDTYRNEDLAVHKDIAVLYNDGTAEKEAVLLRMEGCDARIRYHEHRDDFEASTKTSRAKVIVQGNEVQVFVDATNGGAWSLCSKVTVPLAVGWSRTAHIGLSASTGQLADNHDVIRLDTYSNIDIAEEEESKKRFGPKFAADVNALPEERILKLENMVNIMLVKLDQMEHHSEHDMVALRDHVKDAEQKMRAHDVDIENMVKRLDRQVAALESRLQGEVSVRFADATVAAAGWKLPFTFLILLLLLGAIALNRWYNKLRKSHIL